MNRNTEYQFGQVPKIKIKRSLFKMEKNIKTSFDTGQIIPFYVDQDILPGDTWKCKQSVVIRMATPIAVPIDNLVADFYYFAVPYRIVWDNFKKFMGENEQGAWAQQTQFEIPNAGSPTGTGFPAKSTADYMGLPTGKPGLNVSMLPFRAYIIIYNEFFRNQNLIAPIACYKGDQATTPLGSTSTFLIVKKASRIPDYLSTCLPAPQKGNPVNIPLGTTAPVKGNGMTLGLTDGTDTAGLVRGAIDGGAVLTAYTDMYNTNTGTTKTGLQGLTNDKTIGLTTDGDKSGLIADLTGATAATINALRLSFQTQKLLELGARYGTRYVEVLKSEFGVISPDGRQQRPEYLGGCRTPITINQVAQTSSSDTTSPQGNVSGFSITADVRQVFTKSFTEHTIIMGLCVVRILKHSYQQKIERQWLRRNKLDFYTPILAHLGEQPVYNKEIYAQGSSVVDTDGNIIDDQVFGYQERWAEYKYKDSSITAELRSTYSTPLDMWHYGDYYGSLPVLSQNWLEEQKTAVDRTLAVQNQNQFIMDCSLFFDAYRPIPCWTYPGLIDHF